MATAEGDFTIPGATITADGNQMVSNSVQVRVLPADQAANGASGMVANRVRALPAALLPGHLYRIVICLLQLLPVR